MTASPPAVPSDKSPYVWARSLKGALSAAQQLALQQIDRLTALELAVLTKPLRQAADALADGGPDDLEYAGKVLGKAAQMVRGSASLAPKAEAVDVLVRELGAQTTAQELVALALEEAQRLIATQIRYSYEGPERGPGRRAYQTIAIGESFKPKEYPVRIEFLNAAQDKTISGGVYIDPDHSEAEAVPTLVTAAEAARRYAAQRKKLTRPSRAQEPTEDRRGMATIASELQRETTHAVSAWERMERELKDDRAVRLLKQSDLHVHLRQVAQLAEEQLVKTGSYQASRQGRVGRPSVTLASIAEKLDSEKENIRALLRRDTPIVQIARQVGVSTPKLRSFIDEEGLRPGAPPVLPARAQPVRKPAVKRRATVKKRAGGKR